MSGAVEQPSSELLEDLVAANRILYAQKIVDGLGHVSIRHDKNPNLYVMAAERAPGLVSRNDLAIYDLDSIAQTLADRRPYNERFIHGEIYKARPDVRSIVHCHTPSLLPFAVCKQADLRPLYHMSGFLGRGAARFEIRDFAGAATDLLVSTPALGKSLAGCLGDKQLILMRGHGATLVGETVRHSVYRAIYAAINATVQAEAMRLGEVTYLSPEEAESGMNINDRFNQRSWELWKLEALGGMK